MQTDEDRGGGCTAEAGAGPRQALRRHFGMLPYFFRQIRVDGENDYDQYEDDGRVRMTMIVPAEPNRINAVR